MQICVEKESRYRGKNVCKVIKQHIYVEKYDWNIYAIYNFSINDFHILQDAIDIIDGRRKDIFDAYKFFNQNKLNIGLTYTNYNTKSTVVVIGKTDSAYSFINTFTHELAHVQNHISKYYNLDVNSEEVCYLIGDLAQRMSHKCSSLFCNCCRQ